MRNLKKFLALVLAMMMALSLMVTANAANAKTDYPDMDNVLDEFEEAVDVLSGMGVFRGNNGSFLPQNSIMRCEAVAILYRLVTGDVDDTQVKLYSPLATYFTDVKADDWFAPYVGFAVDAGYIKGYNGKFNPYDNVTGYEMLAMLLRAVGYGKNGEFTGSLWQINVGSQAQALGVLTNIQSTHYANTLSRPSPREVVAELTFQVAATVPTVRYELGYYNPWVGVAVGTGGNIPNPTLGEKVFGLASATSVIVGNQATSEEGTRLGIGYGYKTEDTKVYDEYNAPVLVDTATGELLYKYDENTKGAYEAAVKTDGTLDAGYTFLTTSSKEWTESGNYEYGALNTLFDFKTGLDQFAHEVTVWFDSRTGTTYHTYALIDHVESDKAFYAQTTINTTTVEDVTGVDVGNVMWSDRYSRIGSLAYDATSNMSPISTYRKVVNPNGGVVYIALSAEVGVIEEKNTTAKVPYLTLGNEDTAVSLFTNEAARSNSDRIYLSKLTPDTKDEQKEIGALVTAYQIVGTANFDLAKATTVPTTASATDMGKVMYQLDPMKPKTVTVATYKAPDNTTGINSVQNFLTELTPAGADTMKLSGITEGNKIISSALPIAARASQAADATRGWAIAPLAGMTYTVYEDLVGRFISLVPVAETKFVYGTYAGYELDGFNAGTIKYNMVGVGWDAQKQTEDTIKLIGTTAISGDEAPITGANYNGLGVTKKDQGQVVPATGGGNTATPGNEIKNGVNTGYMYNASTGALYTAGLNGTPMADGATWNFTSADAGYGFKKVTSDSVHYLVTNDTEFIIVTGTGTATLKVDTAKGITGLLAGGTSADITKTAVDDPITGDMNNVYFQTDTDLFGTVHTNENAVILKVILSDGNLTRWNTQTLYFNYRGADATGVKLPGVASGRNVEQYALWNNGQLGYYFIDIDASLKSTEDTRGTPDSWTTADDIERETFYTLAKIDDVNGIPVYKAVALASPDSVNYTTGYNSQQLDASDAVIYDYVTVNNLSTALLTKGDSQLVYSISSDVKVCDVQWKTNAAFDDGTKPQNIRSEITTVRELNNAVSVMLSDASTAAYDDIEVAVVYDGSVITCIYVTEVPEIST